MTRLEALACKRESKADLLSWAACLVQFDIRFAKKSISQPDGRIVELVNEMRSADEVVWQQRLIYRQGR